MAVKTGRTMNIIVDNSSGATVDLSSYADGISFGFPVDMLDTSTFGSSSKSFVPGFTGGDDIVINFRYDPTVEAQLAAISPLTATSSLIISPEGTTTGNAKKMMETFLMDYKVSASPESIDEIVATFRKTGAVTHTTWA